MIEDIISEIDSSGGSSYFVGGCVRDEIIGIPPKDIDIEVYGIYPEHLIKILSKFGKVTLCGESFGVFKIGDFDFAIPRKEVSIGRSHKTIEVDCDPFLSPKLASYRRDFTWNALMKNTMTGDILDFHNGVNDLKFGIVRHVDDNTFTEDPLRMIRAAKFASRFGFIVAHKTVSLIRENKEYVRNLSTDRIFGEISDILMKSKKPSYGLKILDYLELLEILLPEIWALKGVEQNAKWHPEGNAFNHTGMVVDYEPIESRNLIEQLARLYHDVGKLCGSIGHHERSYEIVRETFPNRLTNDADIINNVSNIVRNHMSLYGGDVTRARVKRLASKVDISVIVRMCRADKLSRPLDKEILMEDEAHLNKFLEVYGEVVNEVEPIIKGRDIQREFPNIRPGPIFKKILDEVYDRQLDDMFSNHEDGIVILREVVNEHPDSNKIL